MLPIYLVLPFSTFRVRNVFYNQSAFYLATNDINGSKKKNPGTEISKTARRLSDWNEGSEKDRGLRKIGRYYLEIFFSRLLHTTVQLPTAV